MTQPQATVTLELTLPVEDIAALRRRLGGGLGRARALALEWHDDGEGRLAQGGVALLAWREGRLAGWRAERLDPAAVPGAAAAVLAEAGAADDLRGVEVPQGTMPVQSLAGRVRSGLVGDVMLRLVEGRLQDEAPVARLALTGPAAEVSELALALAAELRLAVPARGLAAEALSRAGVPVPARRLGAPDLPTGLAPGAAFAHAAGHLLGVLLHHAPAAAAGQVGEPVHQMRVALRRLRALASVFGDAVACPELDEVRPALKALAGALGPARDWDVFLGGTGRRVAAAFPQEAEVAALLEAAAARRAEAYAALATLLAGPELRCLGVRVAVLALARPWDGVVASPPDDTAAFGAAVLARRLRRVARLAGRFDEQPEAALHEMRLKAKRLRYAAEVFAPLFPGREAARFLRRLAALQEALGHLNDGAVATALMQALEPHGGAGLAGGLVRGFVAGRAGETRQEIAQAWKRLRKAGPFWT
jgi:CHAD domain-containing protein